MTFLELATQVANKCHKNDNDSINKSKDYVKQAYRHIWDSFLWNDSKISVTQSFTANTGDFDVDASIYLVMSVIWNNKKLQNIQQDQLFTLYPDWLTRTGDPNYYVNQPKNTSGDCVIRLDTKPTETQNVVILGKSVFTQLSENSDEPKLKGVDNTILAFAEAWFLEFLNQRGSAQTKIQEANLMMNTMISLEKEQQTYMAQVVPIINDIVYSGTTYFDNSFLPK